MIRMRTALVALAIVGLVATAPTAQADRRQSGHDTPATTVFTLDPSVPGDNPEGVAWDRRSRMFFVGGVASGTIYRASLRDSTLRPFITPDPPPPVDSAIG